MQKIAILSDVHGNVTALQEVVNDVKKEKCTETWYIGDLMRPGPGVNDLIELLKSINMTTFVRGNWDDVVLDSLKGISQGKKISPDNPEIVYVTILNKYVLENISPENLKLLEDTKLREVKEIEGLKISLTHNLPQDAYGGDLWITNPTENFDKLFINEEGQVDEDIDIAVIGHTHRQLMRYSSKEQFIINPGSVGMPFSRREKFQENLDAHYTILEIENGKICGVNFKRVPYDHDVELELAKERNLPYNELYKLQMETGEPHIHDVDLLIDVNEKYGYREQVVDFLDDLNLDD